MSGVSFLAILKDSGQKYMFFFDDDTTDKQLRKLWRKMVRDPGLCFNQNDNRTLCERLVAYRKRIQDNPDRERTDPDNDHR